MADIYGATALTGGGATALDSIDGADLSDGDAATVITDAGVYWYHLNATSAATENSPFRIAPDSNAGDKRWHLVGTTSRLGAMVKLASDVTLSNDTWTDVSWDVEEYDDAGFWDSGSPTKFVIPVGVTGVMVYSNIFWENSGADTERKMRNLVNNAIPYGAGENVKLAVSEADSPLFSTLRVSAADYVELNVKQVSGGNLDLKAGQRTWFAIKATEFA